MAPDAHFSPLRISVEAVNQFIYLWRFKLSFAYSILSFLKSPFSVSLDSNLSELSVQCFPIWLFRSFSLSHSPFDETPDGMTKKLCLKWRRSERDWNVKRWNVILSWLRKQKKVLQVWNFISKFPSQHAISYLTCDNSWKKGREWIYSFTFFLHTFV